MIVAYFELRWLEYVLLIFEKGNRIEGLKPMEATNQEDSHCCHIFIFAFVNLHSFLLYFASNIFFEFVLT